MLLFQSIGQLREKIRQGGLKASPPLMRMMVGGEFHKGGGFFFFGGGLRIRELTSRRSIWAVGIAGQGLVPKKADV